MAKNHLSRKLAVLLHADVVGSTSLVQKDETLAHERIQDTFRRFSETIGNYGGVALEIRGDALVAEFAKASDSISASLAFQAANTTLNEHLSDDILPVLRIGIAMGEVVVADNTVTGEGIVLAQRLEQLAEPGSVCIQGAAYDTLPKRLPFELNPNDAEALCRIGLCLTFMGKNDEGIERLEQSLQLDPFGNSVTEWYLGVAYFITRRYREAIGALKGSRAGLAEVQAWLAAAYAQAGLTEKAEVAGAAYMQAAIEEMKGNDVEPPASWIEFLAERCPFLNKDDMEHFVDGLRKAGLPK